MDVVPLPRTGRLWKSKADFFRPFRSAAESSGENIAPLYDPQLHRNDVPAPDLKDLNTCLETLVDIFPDVEPEVFREMLLNVSEDSRVELVTENMLKRKTSKWVRNRNRNTTERKSPTSHTTSGLEPEDMFRGVEYREAVKQVFYQEFKNLSHSTIKGVMAEWNYSYALSRPVLQHLASKSWRFTLPSFWKRSAPSVASEHPYIIWQPSSSGAGNSVPAVRRTGSAHLDHELYELFVEPVLTRQKQEDLAADLAYANKVNEEVAEEAGALYDCECCFDSVPFEQLSTCDQDCHQLCFACIRRTVKEAVYGQGWARTADLEKTTVRCFSPLAQDCHGSIPADVVCHALSAGTENDESWQEFQRRAANEALIKSRLALQRCPFCNYAEVNETPSPKLRPFRDVVQHIVKYSPPVLHIALVILAGLLTIFALPVILLFGLIWSLVLVYPPAASTLHSSWSRVYKRRQGPKFTCRHPACAKTSCVRCMAHWRDPHICFESEKTSLRTAIEASATNAIKRTCPKCLLSFVKSSGCNKLVCNCGYTMCYVCRQEITSKEGYAHFCQHFRPNGGRCQECERCDLYGDEDEETAIRRAAEAAEKAWREKEGVVAGGESKDGEKRNDAATQLMVEALVEQKRPLQGYEVLLDAVVDALIAS